MEEEKRRGAISEKEKPTRVFWQKYCLYGMSQRVTWSSQTRIGPRVNELHTYGTRCVFSNFLDLLGTP